MKKVKSYNLDEEVISAVNKKALSDGRKDSDWLNRYLSKLIKTKTVTKAKFDFKSAVLGLGVDPVVLGDWLEVRRKKKAANTETAFNTIVSEISKSGLPADIAIAMAAGNSWSGFKASWVNKSKSNDQDFSDDKVGWSNQDYGLIR